MINPGVIDVKPIGGATIVDADHLRLNRCRKILPREAARWNQRETVVGMSGSAATVVPRDHTVVVDALGAFACDRDDNDQWLAPAFVEI